MNEHEFKKIIQENLEGIEDIELVLLKGHLVIEQLLTEMLELNMSEPERLKIINPMFAKKLEMYLAFEGNSVISSGLEAILKEMNILRNKLAHNLNHPGFNELLISWTQRAARKRIEDPENKQIVKETLISAISQISAFLAGVVMAKKHITTQSTRTENTSALN